MKKNKLKKIFEDAWKRRNKKNPVYQKVGAYKASKKMFNKVMGIDETTSWSNNR